MLRSMPRLEGTLRLSGSSEPARTRAEVRRFVAEQLGVADVDVDARPLGGGFSADAGAIFEVTVKGANVGVLKVFQDQTAAFVEARMQDRVAAGGVSAPVPLGVFQANVGGKNASAILMKQVAGRSLQAELALVPRPGQPGHEAATKQFAEHVVAVAGFMARFYKKLGAGHPLSDAIKQNRGVIELERVEALRASFGAATDEIKAALAKDIIPAYESAPILATVSHGDANLGNFLVDDAKSVSTVDLVNMEQSLTAGEGHTTAAKDVAYFAWLLRHYASVATPWAGNDTAPFTSDEAQRLTKAFLGAYLAASNEDGAALLPALRFYAIDRELEAVRLGWDSAANALPRIRELLG
jgi:hypothetical protein